MRGCLTLLVLMGAVGYVFVALGFSAIALVVGFVIWCLLWVVALVCTMLSDASKNISNTMKEELEDDEPPVR